MFVSMLGLRKARELVPACSLFPSGLPSLNLAHSEAHTLSFPQQYSVWCVCGTAAESRMEMQADNINTLVNTAGIKMEPYWANLFSKLFANKNIGDLIANVGAGKGPSSAEAWNAL